MGFDGLTCTSDIASALRGRKMPDARVAEWEQKYSALSLKALGADLPEDGTTLILWRVCGDTYALLERSNKVSDVVHVSGDKEPSPRMCKRGAARKSRSYLVVGLKGSTSEAAKAWSVNYKKASFAEVAVKGLTCESP